MSSLSALQTGSPPEPSLRVRARAALELRRRSNRRIRLLDYIQTHSQYTPSLDEYDHVESTLIPVAQRVIDGELKRVLILMPPRYFKSEVFSRFLPACYLHNHPTHNVGLTSYGSQLAWELSEEARTHYQAGGGTLSGDTSAKRRWRVVGPDGRAAGGMWAEGVGGSLLGRGFNLGIVDDPQDPEQAHSPTYQARFRHWYPEKFLSRQEPDASIVVVMQRLGPNDAIDFLFEREADSPEHWYVVCMDEIKSNEPLWRGTGEMGLPETCTLHHDDREIGQILAPERFDEDTVEQIQRSAGTYTAKAQRQQRPTQASGDFWRADWFKVHKALPPGAHNGGYSWDTAYTKNERNSASAYIQSFKGPGTDFTVYIEDVDWDWLEFPELVEWMRRMGGPHDIEDKAAGKSAVQSLTREGVTASEVQVDGGDKLARASSVQPIVAQGRVSVNERIYDKLLRGHHVDVKRNGRQGLLSVTAEALATDTGDLDVNDAFVQAITRHVGSTASDWSSAGAVTDPRNRRRRHIRR